jgi:O-acetyl-ADP-ribose deacetylase (regulator of RNase III)
MIKHINGNLLKLAENGQFDIIMHGCNCFNTFGSGIAKSIKLSFPTA